jgi:hypothetical protein
MHLTFRNIHLLRDFEVDALAQSIIYRIEELFRRRAEVRMRHSSDKIFVR